MGAETQKLVDEMLEDGIVDYSNSVWNSPVVLVKKKDNTYRSAFDYRKLNQVAKSISHPSPGLEYIFTQLGKQKLKYFQLWTASGFWQIPMDSSTCHTAAFITHNGVYE